ncbi:S8 family serine peptidase [Deinococcus navajonensis]|uniref:S8 family serine peptidase n=1 Tax=Deinococcus navajonensis TaxID=309884 RepID=A0ABV8XS93_9DEIO
MRLPVFSFLLPALLLASCGMQSSVPATAAAPDRLLTVATTPVQSDADLAGRYGGRVVLRTSTFAVIGDPAPQVAAQGLGGSKIQLNRGVLQATGAVELWGDGAVELWGDGAVELWGDGAVELWGDGAVELWGDGAEAFWVGGRYSGLPANTQAWKSIGLESAHQHVQHLGQNVTVAVIDTGVDTSHPMLKVRMSDPGTWKDFVDGDTQPQEVGAPGQGEYGHGTVIAGIIAQMAPNARLMPLRVLNPSGGGDVLNVASAIVWAADHGADVINLSLGASQPVQAITSAIEYANSLGVAVTAAAGNTGRNALDYPASSFTPTSLNVSVGSVNADGQRSAFSSYGPALQLNAPGEHIGGPFPGGLMALATGTSMSAPVVAGALALGMGEGRTPQAAVDGLRASATSLDSVSGNAGYAGQLGAGKVNLDAYTKPQ